jgi:hypothetical protein
MSTSQRHRFVTRQEAADLLDLGVRAIDYHIRRKHLRTKKQKNRVLIDRLDVERLMGTTSGPVDPREEEAEAIYRGFDSTYLRELSSIHERLEVLEHISGISLRGHGISKTRLLSLMEEAIRRNLTPDSINDEEKARWILAMEHFNAGVVQYCLKNPELRELPIWLMKLGHRLLPYLSTKKEKTRVLLAVRHLRYLLEAFEPSYPLVKCQFHIPHRLSPIDGLILASQAA